MIDDKGKTIVTYHTPKECEERVGHVFKGGVTLINKETNDAEIIIDSRLSSELQEVYLEHEQVQLQIIRNGFSKFGENILPQAHFIGLEAGFIKAKELGIEEQYRKHRGERE